ncbi:MAG: HNH endonuclease signature motif containing protein [Nocardioides sp.]|uniref:HNH endonuclease signature motif containing protein n=1 Tax=Nocardioides sp. TaxID=35761 RepID=UPI0039E4D1DC
MIDWSGRKPLDSAEALLDETRALADAAQRAECLLLLRAAEWADQHPAIGEDGAWEDTQVPAVQWDAPAEFALAAGLSHEAGTDLIHQALELRHRLPDAWKRVQAFELPAWRARRLAERTIGEPSDVVASINKKVGPIAHKIGLITLGRLIDEEMARLHAEERECEQVAALDRRDVRLFDDITHGGVATIEIRADLKDALEFDDAVARVAAALRERGCTESLDVRRSMAVGVLADPQGALDLLSGTANSGRPRKHIKLFVHLTDTALQGREPVGRLEWGQKPIFEQQVREWCGRTDTHLTVTGVVDLAGHQQVEAYEVPDRIATQVELLHQTCVFPHCRRPARRCDKDHIIPDSAGGPTCSCNLAPLCRRHHRLKTLKGWSYERIGPATYRWRSPHGLLFQRDPTGTVAITESPPDPPDPPRYAAA